MLRRASILLCWVMSALMCLQLLPTQALAYPEPQTVEGTYDFTMTQSGCKQTTDNFVFREDCFMRSSFLGCTHLAELSAQLSLASIGWFGDSGDPYEDNVDDTGHNVRQALTAMGFQDVQTNGYYSCDTLPDSVGVAVGHRAITVADKSYTLLAIAVRSAGYKREWVGSFGIGEGDITQGFLAARDEALRFVKKYVSDHNITNDLKIWVAGHSRGAAVANMVGGFLAGGGDAYLGDDVAIDPDNVYCHCFATPSTVKAGTPKETELSVAGARGNAYAQDTPGEAYVSSATGALDPADVSIYGGIRTYQNELDFIPLLPPASWGFTRYGVSCALDGSVVSSQDMAAELATINANMYDRYTNGGDPSQFTQVKPYVLDLNLNSFSLDDLSFVPVDDEGGATDQSLRQFLERRAAGLAKDEPTNAEYASHGYEDTLRSAIGLFFLTNDRVIDGGLGAAIVADTSNSLVKATALGYLANAASQLIDQGRAANETESCVIVLEGLLSYVYGDQVELQTTGDFLKTFGKMVHRHENTALVQSLIDKIAAAVPEDKVDTLIGLLSLFGFGSTATQDEVQAQTQAQTQEGELTDDEMLQLAQIVRDTMANLLDGGIADEQEVNSTVQADDSQVQRLHQPLANFFKALETSSLARLAMYKALALVSDDAGIGFGNLKDSTPFADTLGNVFATFLKKDDGSPYASLGEASDALLVEGIQAIGPTIVEGARLGYSDSYADELAGYLEALACHPTQLRTIAYNTLFGAVGYDFAYHMVTIATLLANSEVFVVTHVGEQYLAWIRAVRKAVGEGAHTIYYPVTVTAEPAAGGTTSASMNEVAVGTKVTLSAKANKGYAFAGWTAVLPASLSIDGNSFTVPDSAVEVCANFRRSTYEVAFKANGGKGSMAKQGFTYGTKQALAANAFTRTGFSFAGWNTKADGSGTAYKNKQAVKNLSAKDGATVTLYAQWKEIPVPSAQVSVRMQKLDWLKAVKDGAVAGKTRGKRYLEAVKIRLSRTSVTGGIEYRTYLRDKGWQSTWARDGKASGDTKKSQHLDGVQIRLYGKMKKKYDVYYRMHVQEYGWTGWCKNGQKAGAINKGRNVGAIQVVLVAKGGKVPADLS